MINKFGLPVKDYLTLTVAMTPVVAGSSVMAVLLNIVTALRNYLMEKASVPRRVSAYDRQKEPTYITG